VRGQHGEQDQPQPRARRLGEPDQRQQDGVGQQVRRRMAQDLDPVAIPLGDDRHFGIGLDSETRVDQFSVHPSGERRARQPRADGGGDLGHGDWPRKGLYRSVWKFYV